MVSIILESMIERACNGLMASPDIGLNLDIAEIVKAKNANARKALDKILRIARDEIDRQSAFLAIQLLDCLMVNCGYPVRFLMTRKENLNRLVERFPPSPSVNLQHRPLIPLHLHVQFQLDHAMKRTLKLINKWKLSLSDKSRHRHDFSNIVLMHDLLASKSFLFPPISSEEIDAIVGLELQTLRTKESLQDEERVVLETKLEYYLSRGTPGDIKRANEIMKQMIDCQVLTRHESSSSCLQDSTKYSTADSQILQDLRRLEDKVALLEDLVKAEEDESGVAVLLQNHTISQMYRASRDEIPKLLELANSNLSESLMRTLISITERIGAVKLRVEGPEKDCHPDSPHAANVRPPVSLHHSTDALDSPLNAVESTINRPVFHDLPQLSPAQPSISTTIVARPVAFQHNSEICLDMLQVGHARTILRILNVSDGELRDIKLNGKSWASRLQPLESICRTVTDTAAVSVTYMLDSERRGTLAMQSLNQSITDGIENLLLI